MPRVILTESFTFDAAHVVGMPVVTGPDGQPLIHPCNRIHGHTYKVEVSLAGEVNPQTGMLIDYYELQAAFEPVRKQLDHTFLNNHLGLEKPTAEVVTLYIWDRLKEHPALAPLLCKVTVHEGATARCTYWGE